MTTISFSPACVGIVAAVKEMLCRSLKSVPVISVAPSLNSFMVSPLGIKLWRFDVNPTGLTTHFFAIKGKRNA